MLNVAAIVVSIISLVTSIGVAGLGAWFTYRTDERKAIREAESLLRKYREPLLLAAQDLQSRLFNMLDRTHPDRNVLSFARLSEVYQDAMFVYTAFLVGQYLAWTNILRRQAQFTAFTTEEKQPSRTKKFIGVLDSITDVLNTGWHPEAENAQFWERWAHPEPDVPLFILFKGHQRAIGEIMTVREDGKDGELLCMGYSEFSKKWKKAEDITSRYGSAISRNARDHPEDAEILTWFLPVTHGILALVGAHRNRRPEGVAENTLRVLQHLLVDLVQILDPKGLRPGSQRERKKAGFPTRALGCWCESCRLPQQEIWSFSSWLGNIKGKKCKDQKSQGEDRNGARVIV
ncbi:uncharacterized protein N7458_002822 [Penicillium daleae]|uniref:Uncharacterized protein n=1 Tax=Penicillium daleae TaxID=63821 RepID=A0AAD6CGH6_9EURO|nr:uncharacterized protein N7458_002822 [Penicillium daleae]KAJ5461270.1 hypothetical protein N7458_002822 [Penicillium daleae]